MLHVRSSNIIPPQFNNLSTIRNIETKSTLIASITMMFELLGEVNGEISNEETSHLLERYFAYLEQSCQSMAAINRRAQWLVTYSFVVTTKLLSYRNQTVVHDTTHESLNYSDLMNKIAEMTQVIGELQALNPLQLDKHEALVGVIDSIIDLVSDIKPRDGAPFYPLIIGDVQRLINFFGPGGTKMSKTLASKTQASALNALWKLHYSIGNYRDRRRVGD